MFEYNLKEIENLREEAIKEIEERYGSLDNAMIQDVASYHHEKVRQLGEKMWGAVVELIKAIAENKNGIEITSYGEIIKYAKQLLTEDEFKCFRIIRLLHVNFYDGNLNVVDVIDAFYTYFKKIYLKLRGIYEEIKPSTI